MTFIDIETEVSPLEDYRLHRFSGYSIRSHIYNIVFKRDGENKPDLHESSEIRFFRVSPLYTYNEDNSVRIMYMGTVTKGKTYYYRFSIFGKKNVGKYYSKIMDFIKTGIISLDNHKYHAVNRVIRISTLKDIKKSLREGDKIAVDYLTPTYFRSSRIYSWETFDEDEYRCECRVKTSKKNVNIPFPHPSPLIKGLLRIYKSYIGKIDDRYSTDLQLYLNEDGILLSGYPMGIRTKKVGESKYMFNIGFVGKVYYHLTDCEQINDNKSIKNLIRLLLRIGEYTNVGGGRTAGLGWIKTELRIE